MCSITFNRPFPICLRLDLFQYAFLQRRSGLTPLLMKIATARLCENRTTICTWMLFNLQMNGSNVFTSVTTLFGTFVAKGTEEGVLFQANDELLNGIG